MRFRLHTLLMVLAFGPPALAGVWFCASLAASPARVNVKNGPVLEPGVTREQIDAARREARNHFSPRQ